MVHRSSCLKISVHAPTHTNRLYRVISQHKTFIIYRLSDQKKSIFVLNFNYWFSLIFLEVWFRIYPYFIIMYYWFELQQYNYEIQIIYWYFFQFRYYSYIYYFSFFSNPFSILNSDWINGLMNDIKNFNSNTRYSILFQYVLIRRFSVPNRMIKCRIYMIIHHIACPAGK